MLQENVTAVLTASTTDVLSHVAIRARSQKVSPCQEWRVIVLDQGLQCRQCASIKAAEH